MQYARTQAIDTLNFGRAELSRGANLLVVGVEIADHIGLELFVAEVLPMRPRSKEHFNANNEVLIN
jgi:hypothetical protein